MSSYEELENKWKKIRSEMDDDNRRKQDGSCKEYEEAKKNHTQRLSEND